MRYSKSASFQFLLFASGVLLADLSSILPSCAQNTKAQTNSPVIIAAGPEWIPLQPQLDIEPGSALDFSAMGLTDAPAGKHGRVITRGDGQFAFADSPDKAQRFYGVNFCFSALSLSHEQSDRIAERLARLGYNAFRIHHYERELTQGQKNSVTLNPQKLEQFDYLMSALIRRGIYLTTDLFVSRGIPWRDVGVEKDGEIPMDTFKILVPVHQGALENWKQFSRALLNHTNTYTHRRYADEPALAWIAMINEGNFGNFFKDIQTLPEWKEAWNKWLGKRHSTREDLAKTWGAELRDDEDPARQSVALPEKLQASGFRSRDCIAFLADTERDMVQKMKTFLHDELGCRALISNSSSWTRFTTDQGARQVYDYVDDHFYVDHPQFLRDSWRLPSRSSNTSPISEGAAGGGFITFTRLFDKPFTVTEYNYSGPGRFRGVGGILTGALGALQGWGGIWRFAYSHSRQNIFDAAPMGYFDMATDPLSQAAERASLCLFLRGDLRTAPHSVGLVMTEADLAHPAAKIPTLAPNWHWLAWVTRVGTQVVPSPNTTLSQTLVIPLGWQTPASAYDQKFVLPLDPYALDSARLASALQQRGLCDVDASLRPSEKLFRSETGEITIDGPRGILLLDTPRTAGGYAPAGQSIEAAKGALKIRVIDSDATVWISALDQYPIPHSKHLLVTHLTDLQNTEIQYTEAERKTLLQWGHLPYLVRAGKAEIRLPLDDPSGYKVWALSLGGKRLAEVAARTEAGGLVFTADVAADSSSARMLYEIALR
jgi:hypothetical protein